MPATQRGQAYRLGPTVGDCAGTTPPADVTASPRSCPRPPRSTITATSSSPSCAGDPVPMPELTLAEVVALYLERHAATARPWTIATPRERLRHAVAAFGDVPLRDLERMASEIACGRWRAQPGQLPPPHLVARCRVRWRRSACAHLRHALYVRLSRARRRASIHALARIVGTSVRMIERHYGTLLDGAMESIAWRLDALDAERDLVETEVSG